MLAAALSLRPGRIEILTEEGHFPTDGYVAQGLAGVVGGHARMRVLPKAAFAEPGTYSPETAVVMLTHVDYRTGEMHDMATVTKAAQAAGALMLWDLSHSTGAVPVDLGAAGGHPASVMDMSFANQALSLEYVATQHQNLEPDVGSTCASRK